MFKYYSLIGIGANHNIFSLYDKNQFNHFAVHNALLSGQRTVFLHMPYANSRIIVGGYGNYLLSEGHKMIVRNGSSLVEGDFFSEGSVGIGTRNFIDGSETYRLSVKGKVRADEVKVYTTWADFVFEDDYRLPSLYEVESYINENGHLKDVPSEVEVLENGINVGEMNKILLQKIEELTLYTIQLQKEIDELKNK